MSVRIVVDMNLSVEWIDTLAERGWSAVHQSTVGDPRAEDTVIMAWALANAHVVFTHDLDFGTTLALTHVAGPSVIQVRGQDVLPEHMGPLVVAALHQHDAALAAGALVVVEEKKTRVRVLPLQQSPAMPVEPGFAASPGERVEAVAAEGLGADVAEMVGEV